MGLLAYVGRRLLAMLPVLLGVAILVFGMLHLIPGDPVRLAMGEDAAPEDVARVRAQLGLDRPLHEQFVLFLGRVVQLDFGTSLRSRLPVARELGERLGPTLQLAVSALAVAGLVGIPLGVIAAVKRATWVDTLAMFFAVSGVSAPSFSVGLILILFFAVRLQWLPVVGYGDIRNLILPATTLGLHYAAVIARITRATMLELLHEDFIRTARAKGVNEFLVVGRHALRNALIPTVTIMGLQMGALLGGSAVVETIFAWPGIGRLIIEAVKFRDYPVIQAGVLYLATMFMLCNLIVDVAYAALDPRVRYS